MQKTFLKHNEKISKNYGFVITEKKVEKDKKWDLHWHDYFEFEIIAEGCGEHTYNQQKIDIGPGSAYIMSHYDFHSIKAYTDMTIINISFDELFLDSELTGFMLNGVNKFNCAFSSDELSCILTQTKKLTEEISMELPFKNNMLKGILTDIIIRVIRKSKFDQSTPMPTLIQKTVNYMCKNFRSDISLKSVAKEMFVTPNYLGTTFKKTIGMSYNGYLNLLRLKYACNLITNSTLAIKEIAFASGYNSAEYFMYTFKNVLGTTPAKYRKSAI